MGMLKYVDTDIVFQEIPDEVTIAVNISNCPCRCKGCHSKYLWADTGKPLTTDTVDGLMSKYGGEATCFCFMGGDADPEGVASLSRYVRGRYPGMKTGWYSGRSRTAVWKTSQAASGADNDRQQGQRPPFALQYATYHLVKGHLSRCERWPFALY